MDTSTISLLILFFTTGLTVGFGHCTGMCGPIAVALSLNTESGRVWVAHLLYHTGRIFTYGLLGAAMGITGSFNGVIESMLVIQKAVLIGTGGLVLIMGLAMTGWIPRLHFINADPGFGGFFVKRFHKYMGNRKIFACLPLGIMLGFLPCGPVYVALVAAGRAGMEAGTPLAGMAIGAAVLLSFGLGTTPALFLVGTMSGMAWFRSRKMINTAAAILVMAAGAYFIVRGLR